MQPQIVGGKIALEREATVLDEFVFRFVDCLDKTGIRYVIISGYVAILFGRSRGTEDIDIFIEKIGGEKFSLLWEYLSEKFECVNAFSSKDGLSCLNEGIAIRFSQPSLPVPNVEVKFVSTPASEYSMENSLKVSLAGKELRVGPLEQQVAFKLFLGSEKDLEDAKFLSELFAEQLDKQLLMSWCVRLNTVEKLKLIGASK